MRPESAEHEQHADDAGADHGDPEDAVLAPGLRCRVDQTLEKIRAQP